MARRPKTGTVVEVTGDEMRAEELAGMRTDRWLRLGMGGVMTLLFVALNGAVIWLLHGAIQSDMAMLDQKLIEPGERLITENVYMTLIGGTVVQVAAIVLAIARYVFPAPKE